MKILVVCQYYYPEPFRITDICEALAARGHSVQVVTGVPNYPMGKIYKGYGFGKRRNEIINGVHVHRSFTIGRRSGAIFRLLNYCSYAISASIYLFFHRKQYDAIFANQLSPVMMAQPALIQKKKTGTPVVLYCLDLWPESLIAGGIERESALYRVFHRISRKIYSAADRILITSRSFADYFREEFDIDMTEYLPQYAEAIFNPEQCRKEADDKLDLMFAGNVGAAQSVQTIIEAARLTMDEKRIRWHIVGDGSELDAMKKLASDLPNVVFHGRKPLEEMPAMYSQADAMLVTMQPDPVLSLTLPGKVQTYLAAGKPVLGAADGETPLVIAGAACGFCGAAGDARTLAENARRMLGSDRVAMGENSAKYYASHFQKEQFLDRLESVLHNPRTDIE